MREVATLEEEKAKRPGIVQTLPCTTPGECATGAEPVRLDLATAHHVLREQDYDLVERFGHIHATRDGQEWHLCLVADLASMLPAHLLACLNKALALCVEQSIALSPRV